ncbi:unnamed protein product, partial [Cladocopium goreaui]
HCIPAVQLCFLQRLMQELAEQLDNGWDSWQVPFFEAYVPLFSTPGTMLQERDLALALAASCTSEDKKHSRRRKRTRRRPKVWRLRSDRAESEEVDESDDHADRDGGIAEAAYERL